MRTLGMVGVVVAVTLAAAAPAGATPPLRGVQQTRALIRGIPQDGMVLGSTTAPATLHQAEDPQCPACRQYLTSTLPTVVRREVRTGRARIRLSMFPFIGPDSERGARFVVAAARQDRAFQALDLIYRNQGVENSGYMTDAFLRRIAHAAGLDVGRVMTAMRSPSSAAAVRREGEFGQDHGATGTPTVWTQQGDGPLRQVRDFMNADAISRQLGGR